MNERKNTMKKDLTTLSVQELKNLKSEIEKEISRRETLQTTCIWSLMGGKEKKESQEKTWSGETYIS